MARNRLREGDLDDSGQEDEKEPGTPCATVDTRHCNPARSSPVPKQQRTDLPRRARRSDGQEYRRGNTPPAGDPLRAPRFPLKFSRLGRGVHRHTRISRRGCFGPPEPQPGRSRIPTHRSIRPTPPTHGSLGNVSAGRLNTPAITWISHSSRQYRVEASRLVNNNRAGTAHRGSISCRRQFGSTIQWSDHGEQIQVCDGAGLHPAGRAKSEPRLPKLGQPQHSYGKRQGDPPRDS